MFAGLMSRWITPAWWAWLRPRAASRVILSAVPGVSLPDDPHALCLQFRRGSGCALVVLDGAPLPLDVALSLNLDEFGAMAILDPQEATTLYGQRGAGGAVMLWSR